jgi:hypothetical protein
LVVPASLKRHEHVNRAVRYEHWPSAETDHANILALGNAPVPDKHLGGVTYGGYSDSIVVDEQFVLRVPSNLDLAGAAPLFCAAITLMASARRHRTLASRQTGLKRAPRSALCTRKGSVAFVALGVTGSQ